MLISTTSNGALVLSMPVANTAQRPCASADPDARSVSLARARGDGLLLTTG